MALERNIGIIGSVPVSTTATDGSLPEHERILQETVQAGLIKTFTFMLKEPDGRDFNPQDGSPGEFTLTLNPQSLTRVQPGKNAITETMLGHWADSIGLAAPRWDIKGNFGYYRKFKPFTEEETDGYQAFMEFNNFVRTYFDENKRRTLESDSNIDLIQMWFIDWEDNDYWVIEPTGMPEKQRTSARPLFRDYVFGFVGLKDLLREGDRDQDNLTKQIDEERDRRIEIVADVLDQENARIKAILEGVEATGLTELIITRINVVSALIDDFAEGVQEIFDQTIGALTEVISSIDGTVESLVGLARAADPNLEIADLIDSLRQTKCGFVTLVSYPEVFEDGLENNLASLEALYTNSGCSSTIPTPKPELF